MIHIFKTAVYFIFKKIIALVILQKPNTVSKQLSFCVLPQQQNTVTFWEDRLVKKKKKKELFYRKLYFFEEDGRV